MDARFAGDRLIAVARRERSSRLFAVDTERLELSWQSDSSASEFEPSLRFLGAHALLATNDFVRIYEPERGQVVRHWGNGAEPIAFVARSGVPKLAFAAGERVAIFKAASKPTPTETVTLRGTVTNDGAPAANIRVMAYGTETKTDASGHYSLAFEARGWPRVVALAPQPADVGVTLDGRGTYDVRIEAAQECPEGCE